MKKTMQRNIPLLPGCVLRFGVCCLASSFALSWPSSASSQTNAAQAEPPLRFVGDEKADTSADGGLRLATGVWNIEVVRANRSNPPHADGAAAAHTYLHAPMLAFWKGNFYLEYLSGPRDEHEAPCFTSLTRSPDGLHWETPHTAFPAITLPDGSKSISHQRMGFYVTPRGRLFVLSFYGKAPAPNDGTGLGRALREVHEDGSLGPVYFIRLNAHAGWNPGKVPFPMYSKSDDKGFVADCEALLADKLVTAQWWEEDESKDGFYRIMGRALSYVTRPDGSVVGIWKNALVAVTKDRGESWTEKVFAPGVPVNASKYWLQRTSDGLYALVYNPTTRLRHPLAVSVSADASEFRGLYTVHGELPDQRFGGAFKNMGPQYVRGIVEGNGKAPDSALWLTYSVNKEDIWVSRVPVPVTARVTGAIDENFETTPLGWLPEGWNIYSPAWAPVRVVEGGKGQGHVLELRDEDPHDYARAIRVFPETHGLKLSVKVLARQNDARLEIDLQTGAGARPLRLALEEDGHLRACHEGQWQDVGLYTAGKWLLIELEIPKDPKADRCELRVDGKTPLKRALVFTDPAASVERISFRTGAYRVRGEGGRDLPGADFKVKSASFLLDDLVISPEK
jgi:hypothetical protein